MKRDGTGSDGVSIAARRDFSSWAKNDSSSRRDVEDAAPPPLWQRRASYTCTQFVGTMRHGEAARREARREERGEERERKGEASERRGEERNEERRGE